MLIYGLVAGAALAAVAACLVVHIVRGRRSTQRARHQSDVELVNDCLANVDRVIDLRDKAVRIPAAGRKRSSSGRKQRI
jgi:hypothetical protein